MDIIDVVKSKAAENKYNLSTLSEEYNRRYGENVSRESFFRKIKTETLKYREYEKIMDILGYDVVIQKRKDKINE